MPSDVTAKGYRPVDAADNENGDWDGDLTRREAQLAQKEKRFRVAFGGNILVFLISLCFLAISWFSKPSLLECDRMTSPYCEFAAPADYLHWKRRESGMLTFCFAIQLRCLMEAWSIGKVTSKTSSTRRPSTEGRPRSNSSRRGKSSGIVRIHHAQPRF